jgi:hypothetical protein
MVRFFWASIVVALLPLVWFSYHVEDWGTIIPTLRMLINSMF